MAYELRFSTRAAKQLRKLDRTVAARIADYLESVAALDDPTTRGKNLRGEYGGIWRYRIGDFRMLCDINKRTLTILALEVKYRSKSYQSK